MGNSVPKEHYVVYGIYRLLREDGDTESGGARCSSVVTAFAHSVMFLWIDPSWWTLSAISCFSQCSATGVTKGAVCVILSVG